MIVTCFGLDIKMSTNQHQLFNFSFTLLNKLVYTWIDKLLLQLVGNGFVCYNYFMYGSAQVFQNQLVFLLVFLLYKSQLNPL